MGARDVGGILQRGGTILQTARREEFKSAHGQHEAITRVYHPSVLDPGKLAPISHLEGSLAPLTSPCH